MNKKGHLVGKRFYHLIVKEYLGKRLYKCQCDCGNIKNILGGNLTSGSYKSCGCKDSIHRENYDEEMKQKLLSSIKDVNGCWEWQGARHRQGYGNFPYKRSVHLAHRISWKLFKGEIPINMKVCHKCDNPPCVNPDHLFLGYQKDNVNDMFKKQRKDHKGEKHPRVKLTKQQILEIRDLLNRGITQEIICSKYGITNSHVGSIKHRRTWKDI